MPKSQRERRGGRPWRRRRAEVLARDGHTCTRCGAGGVPLEVHHLVPVKAGGGDELENLTTLCAVCHRGASGYRQRDPREAAWADLLARRWGPP